MHRHLPQRGSPAPRFVSCVVTAALITASSAALAQPAAPEKLKEVTVTSTRTERDVNDVPNSVTVFDAAEIERRQVQDIGDLIRYEPNISVRSESQRRFGNASYNIRGIDGNRVLIQVDGVRLGDEFQFGTSLLNGTGRDTVDLDTLKRVEIVRGSASSLYGSDAIGGVVSYLTKDPSDYMRLTDKPVYLGLRSGYHGADRSWTNGFALAAGREALQGYLYFSQREGHETSNRGGDTSTSTARTASNPQDNRTNSILAKLVFKPAADHEFKFTVEDRRFSARTDVLSLSPTAPRTTGLIGFDNTNRTRFALEHAWQQPAAWINQFKWNVYRQRSDNFQRSLEARAATTATCSGVTAGANNCLRDLTTEYNQNIAGGGFSLEHLFSTSSALHRVVWGGDASKQRTAEERNGFRTILNTGAVTNTIFPDPTFPVRDFPASDTALKGLYIQDEIALDDGKLQIIPGLRWDSYRLSPTDDQRYAINNAAQPAIVAASKQETSASAFSPKLGAVYKLDSVWSVAGNYAHGFRAPSALDSLNAFSNPGSGYILIPNTSLRPETSRGAEASVRAATATANGGLTVFYNKYKDFIDNRNICPNDPRCPANAAGVLQNINVSEVTIWGVEFKGDWRFDRAWTALASVGFTKGDDKQQGAPLNSIDPAKMVLGLRWQPAAHWGGQINGTFVAGKDRVNDVSGQGFRPAAYEVIDVSGFYNFGKQASINFGIFNLFNKKYSNWSDVRLLAVSTTATAPSLSTAANSPVDRYTQPGVNASVTFRYHF